MSVGRTKKPLRKDLNTAMLTRKLIPLLLVCVLSVLLVACGGTPSSAPPAPPASTPAAPSTQTPPSTPATLSTPATPSTPTPAHKTREEEIAEVLAEVNMTLAENEYIGVGAGGMHGKVYIKVTMDGDTIKAVDVILHEETEGIGTLAITAMPDEFVKAQSADIDIVATATLTSTALKNAMQDALDHMG